VDAEQAADHGVVPAFLERTHERVCSQILHEAIERILAGGASIEAALDELFHGGNDVELRERNAERSGEGLEHGEPEDHDVEVVPVARW
jgi:hypothetical protein